MQRTNKEILEKMSLQEKYERTSYASFHNRGNAAQQFYGSQYILYITNNEMPYTEYQGRKVLQHKTIRVNDGFTTKDVLRSYEAINHKYTIVINPPKDQSVPNRPHIHLLLLE